jgi:hypothetical protein
MGPNSTPGMDICLRFSVFVMSCVPVTVAERPRACTVFARSEAGTVGSNPTQGMDVECLCMCVRFYVFVYR